MLNFDHSSRVPIAAISVLDFTRSTTIDMLNLNNSSGWSINATSVLYFVNIININIVLVLDQRQFDMVLAISVSREVDPDT